MSESQKQSDEIEEEKEDKDNDELPQAQNFQTMNQLPIADTKRSRTDKVCGYCFLFYIILLSILAFALFNKQNYSKASFLTDSDGRLCGSELSAYPFLYFSNLPNTSRRMCVKECPSKNDKKLKCFMTSSSGCIFKNTPGFQVTYYQNVEDINRLGRFCMPKDPTLKEKLLQNSNSMNRYIFFNSMDLLTTQFVLGLILSALFCALVQCFPIEMNNFVLYFGTITDFTLLVIVIKFPNQSVLSKLAIGIPLILVLLLLLFYICTIRKSLKINGVFLDAVTKMLNTDFFYNFFYIIVFFLISLLVSIGIILQFWSFWTTGTLTFDAEQSLFWEYRGAGAYFLSVLLFIEVAWVFGFLKESFNFLISASTVYWYNHKKDVSCLQPLKILFQYHITSVIGCSFLTGLFTLTDYVFDVLKPDESQLKEGQEPGLFMRCYKRYCGCCESMFDLVRSDAMVYIVLTGNSYCPSARYCEYLSGKSSFLNQSQSASRTYRICSNFFVSSLLCLYALNVKASNEISLSVLFFILIISIFTSTFFISIHSDAAQALMITFLLNEEVEKRNQEFTKEEFDRDGEDIIDQLAFGNEKLMKAVKAIIDEEEEADD